MNLDSLPEPVADALIKSLLTDVEHLINQHGLSEILVGLAMYCNVQSKAKFDKPNRTEKDEELGFYFRDAAKALEVAASLTYRTMDRSPSGGS
ncbi:hypothetical protein L1047_01855 [Synechococcus sp. Nb3U1]|uniref:hypothetical protein n=1 Tax=Synechococcus sp. Nb3U1 TaxID=1914529 RepID=UPI001F1AA94F|nr:hypothetical protein [Synechococcus sp. Nb3U1]MCF2969940.1 hypothetical protein [Synechococcus sp. Nb3U1]